MTEEFKTHNLVHYCIGCDITGQPIYVTHFLKKTEIKPNYPTITGKAVIGRKSGKKVFQHDHNH